MQCAIFYTGKVKKNYCTLSKFCFQPSGCLFVSFDFGAKVFTVNFKLTAQDEVDLKRKPM